MTPNIFWLHGSQQSLHASGRRKGCGCGSPSYPPPGLFVQSWYASASVCALLWCFGGGCFFLR